MTSFKYRKLVQTICEQIDSGALHDKLPSVRQAAKQYQLGVSTVVQAYQELERLGNVIAKPKQGYFVAKVASKPLIDHGQSINRVKAGQALDMAVQYSLNDPNLLPLSCTAPSSVLDNELLLNKLHRKALATRPYKMLMDDPVEGLPALRANLAKHLSFASHHLQPSQMLSNQTLPRHKQSGLSSNDILITHGRKDSLLVALMSTNALSQPIAVESPISYYLQATLKAVNAEVIEVPMQAKYQDEIALLSAVHDKQAFNVYLVNPNFADPNGRVLSTQDKLALLAWAKARQVTLIEYDRGELYFGSQRPISLALLAKSYPSYKVISIGDFYDTLSPSFSLGYLVAINVFQECQLTKQTICEEPSIALQQMLNTLFDNKLYHKHCDRLRAQMQVNLNRSLDILSPTLNRLAPNGLQCSEITGGPCLWFKLPEHISSKTLWDRAIANGISIAPGAMFSFDERYDNYFRITFALPWDEQMQQGIETLGQLLIELIDSDNG
ncbi:PLP-dependent aminotransferase family protein [Shewanella maritima]|uniref:PLP-dependent aminotransferase family protein n=1 Tax=Shewanella maritima TaxID=2520507 RepID=A0A411PKR1_9GAMM|nr:PLP-dependent aminotransferase family protein [Shewanella maritima]QBF84119.1 PLP-dependent aminotransferase family protein [Shewanella maritima]